jgi:hypothetical protein
LHANCNRRQTSEFWLAAAAAAFFDGLNNNGPRIRGNRPSGAAAAASQQLQDLNAFSEALNI